MVQLWKFWAFSFRQPGTALPAADNFGSTVHRWNPFRTWMNLFPLLECSLATWQLLSRICRSHFSASGSQRRRRRRQRRNPSAGQFIGVKMLSVPLSCRMCVTFGCVSVWNWKPSEAKNRFLLAAVPSDRNTQTVLQFQFSVAGNSAGGLLQGRHFKTYSHQKDSHIYFAGDVVSTSHSGIVPTLVERIFFAIYYPNWGILRSCVGRLGTECSLGSKIQHPFRYPCS